MGELKNPHLYSLMSPAVPTNCPVIKLRFLDHFLANLVSGFLTPKETIQPSLMPPTQGKMEAPAVCILNDRILLLKEYLGETADMVWSLSKRLQRE